MNLTHVDLGLRTDHVITFGMPVPDSRAKDTAPIIAYYRQILGAIQSVAGVSHAAAFTGMPLFGAGFGMPFTIVGQPAFNDLSKRPDSSFGMVTPDYFHTFGIQLLKGRIFNDHDDTSSVKVAMVNQAFADHYFKKSNPLQQQVSIEQLIPGVTKLGPAVPWQIVGVYHNVRSQGLREDSPEILIPFWQIPWPSATIAARTAGDPQVMLKSIAAAIHRVDPDIALATPLTMDQVHDEVMANDRFTLLLFAVFAFIALLLAAIGIYGVMAFSVAQRSHEIAVRMALGSSRSRVVGLIIKEGALLACIGLVIGLIGAYFVGRAMASTLYGVKPLDLSAFSIVGLILLAAALIACYLPARRAASVNPMDALRSE
jgi:predicted permease